MNGNKKCAVAAAIVAGVTVYLLGKINGATECAKSVLKDNPSIEKIVWRGGNRVIQWSCVMNQKSK